MRSLLPLATLLFACTAAAQPTWRFHLAFEDGTGARDTIWMVYDTAATTDVVPWPGPNVDTLLGEGRINIDTSLFNVWIYNPIGDTTKTRAYPYSVFPSFDGTIIDAINWTPPMTITWDTSLFHAPYLPYSQGHFGMAVMSGIAFSQFDQGGVGFGLFNMLIDDHVTIDFLWDYLFTFGVYFSPIDDTGIYEKPASTGLKVWPNPAQQSVQIELSDNETGAVLVSDLAGRRVIELENVPVNGVLDISTLRPGTYLISIHANQNPTHHAIFEKTP